MQCDIKDGVGNVNQVGTLLAHLTIDSSTREEKTVGKEYGNRRLNLC